MSLEYFVPNHNNLTLWESLVCYMFPVMANHLSWYDTVLLPSTGYVKTLLEFLIQHNSHKSNKKVSFDAVNYSSLLVMISSSLITFGTETFAGRNFRDFCDFCPFPRKFLPSKIVKRKIAKGFSSENKKNSKNAKVFSTIKKSERKDLQGTKVQYREDNFFFMI